MHADEPRTPCEEFRWYLTYKNPDEVLPFIRGKLLYHPITCKACLDWVVKNVEPPGDTPMHRQLDRDLRAFLMADWN